MKTLRFAGMATFLVAGCAAGPAAQQAVSPGGSTAVAPATATAGAPDATGEIDRIFDMAKPDTPGCAVAISRNGKQVVSRAYGSADLERSVPITADSVFDIGSLQKQFIAASVLLLVEEGRLSLSDDIRKHVPELPDYGHRITLDHLLTHTSGLRDWTALLPLAADKPTALTAILRQRGTNFAPGEEWAYSNSNYVLLREVVERTSGKPFTEFARTRLFDPLGMKASSYSVDMLNIIRNRALAYEREGNAWKLAMRLDNERGGGGLLTTTGDMLVWNEALTSARLGAFVTEKLQETARLNNGRSLQYARGLIVDSRTGAKLVWHSGGSAGYNAWLGRYPEYGLSIAFACNSDVNGGQISGQIIEQFLPPAVTANAAPQAGAGTADPNLGSRAGLFVSEAGDDLIRLGVERGMLRIAAGPPLVASGAGSFRPPRGDPFFRSQDEFELRFLSPDAFELKSMEGKTTLYRRAQPWSPTAAELHAFAGRYESMELRTVFAIAPGQNGLAARLEHDPERTLQVRPVFRDAFQIGNVTLRFQRDAAGNVVALDYANPLLRGVRLTRLH